MPKEISPSGLSGFFTQAEHRMTARISAVITTYLIEHSSFFAKTVQEIKGLTTPFRFLILFGYLNRRRIQPVFVLNGNQQRVMVLVEIREARKERIERIRSGELRF